MLARTREANVYPYSRQFWVEVAAAVESAVCTFRYQSQVQDCAAAGTRYSSDTYRPYLRAITTVICHRLGRQRFTVETHLCAGANQNWRSLPFRQPLETFCRRDIFMHRRTRSVAANASFPGSRSPGDINFPTAVLSSWANCKLCNARVQCAIAHDLKTSSRLRGPAPLSKKNLKVASALQNP
jgi:hypothetical protein